MSDPDPYSWGFAWTFALGLFLGNWLTGPFIVDGRTFRQSACVGLIAAGLLLLIWPVVRYIHKR